MANSPFSKPGIPTPMPGRASPVVAPWKDVGEYYKDVEPAAVPMPATPVPGDPPGSATK